MIVTVEQNNPVAIETLSDTAFVRVEGDKAVVAIRKGDLIKARRIRGRMFAFAGDVWEAIAEEITDHVDTFIFRRITDGR